MDNRLKNWDIFCNVIDNFGDIGICWRLAKQLANERNFRIRLFVDVLESFQQICPEINPDLADQVVSNIQIIHWCKDFPSSIVPAQVIIEAFACRLPECYEEAMARKKPAPIWINLDYLSAESWVEDFHTRPSPHPRLPLVKHFFFPGFNAKTGGLIRESDLFARKHAFLNSLTTKESFKKWLNLSETPENTLFVSLFSYKNDNLAKLLTCWSNASTPICCLIPVTQNLPDIAEFAGKTLEAGEIFQKGALSIKMLPFVPQDDFDALLWFCDINFVRGEDSFVRAFWAGKPMLWHIYPQSENTHLIKLNAFLEEYCQEAPLEEKNIIHSMYQAWNGGDLKPEYWQTYLAHLPALKIQAQKYLNHLSKQEDLLTKLVRFCHSKL